MKLPQSFIDEVLSRVDVIEIIEQRITLKKTGQANYSGLCPFHQEKTPSFSVSQTKQFYYCFGCKASGNAIGFLMAYEKLSFHEAMENLAAKAGMSLPEQQQFSHEEKKPSTDLLERCANYYKTQLERHPTAIDYLQQRGLTPQIITSFQIGFSPAGWENLSKILGGSLELTQSLLEVGMLIQKSDQSTYDRFRERIMFPIRNRRGQVIAFGGRSLGSQMPKYLNSPESSLFHKSRELYGLYEALKTNKQLKRMIIVEGYLDVVALHQYQFTETVATLGTAISLQHIQTLLRFTDSLLFCFDGDNAGRAAAWRAVEITLPLMHTGVDIKFLFLPNGEDPDSFVRKVGTQGFQEKMTEAIPLADFFFQKLQAETEVNTLAGKTRLVFLVEKYLNKQPKGIFKELMYEKLSSLVGLNIEKIEEILNPTKEDTYAQKIHEPIKPQRLLPPVKLAISLILQSPTLLNYLKVPEELNTIEMAGMDLLRKIMLIINQNSIQNTGSLLEYFNNDSQKPLLAELAGQDLLIPPDAWQNELQGALSRITEIDIEQRIQTLLGKGKKEGLSAEEKILLQNLLIGRK